MVQARVAPIFICVGFFFPIWWVAEQLQQDAAALPRFRLESLGHLADRVCHQFSFMVRLFSLSVPTYTDKSVISLSLSLSTYSFSIPPDPMSAHRCLPCSPPAPPLPPSTRTATAPSPRGSSACCFGASSLPMRTGLEAASSTTRTPSWTEPCSPLDSSGRQGKQI